MKKELKNKKRQLSLSQETVRKLNEADLKEVYGGGSCLPPPLPKS